jgi:AraC-like DNA-binding protein
MLSPEARPSAEFSRFYRLFEGKVEAMHARFKRHRYPRHAHDYLVVGLIPSGAQSYWYRGARHVTPAGDVFLVNAEEAHTGQSADGNAYDLRCFYPKPRFIRELADDIGCPSPPYFSGAVLHDRELSSLLLRAHCALDGRSLTIEVEQFLLKALTLLISRYAVARSNDDRTRHEPTCIRVAKEFIEEHYAEDIPLSRLARLVSLSPYYFARSFQRAVGLPPHAYLENVRIRRARELLDHGESLAAASIAVGYSDQQHFTHRFKRFLGITPGQVARINRKEFAG